jgi:sulfoxide reductase heme-binding subunit YedZ
MLGLFVFFYATIHLIAYVVIDYRLDWQQIFNDVLKKTIYLLGFQLGYY